MNKRIANKIMASRSGNYTRDQRRKAAKKSGISRFLKSFNFDRFMLDLSGALQIPFHILTAKQKLLQYNIEVVGQAPGTIHDIDISGNFI